MPKVQKRPSRWAILAFGLLFIILVGIGATVTVVRLEGWDGFFDRKRSAVRQVMPEAVPLVDEVEERLKDR